MVGWWGFTHASPMIRICTENVQSRWRGQGARRVGGAGKCKDKSDCHGSAVKRHAQASSATQRFHTRKCNAHLRSVDCDNVRQQCVGFGFERSGASRPTAGAACTTLRLQAAIAGTHEMAAAATEPSRPAQLRPTIPEPVRHSRDSSGDRTPRRRLQFCF